MGYRTKKVYQNNRVVIEIETVDPLESKVNCNGENLIWISTPEADEFAKELQILLDKYRI